MFDRYLPATPLVAALAVLAAAFATIVGAWIFQAFGYQPCDLCLEQRYAFYAGIPIAALLAYAARSGAPVGLLKAGLAVLALMFAANAVLSFYHSGIELKLWAGPTACTGDALPGPMNAADLLAAIDKVKIVRCDEVGLRVFGLTLANWDVLICAGLSGLALRALVRRG